MATAATAFASAVAVGVAVVLLRWLWPHLGGAFRVPVLAYVAVILAMGVMLLWRLAPTGAWIARWPLAFIIGTTAGLRLIAYLEADFLKQIEATMIPIWDPQYDATGNFDFGSTFYVSIMQNLLIVLGTLAAYDRVVVRPAQRVGVVDVGEVYRQKEAEFTQLLTRATTDADREKAFALARSFSQRLPAALEELPRDCACLVVLKSAVAGRTPRTVDLTALLQQKLGHPQTPHRNDPEEAR